MRTLPRRCFCWFMIYLYGQTRCSYDEIRCTDGLKRHSSGILRCSYWVVRGTDRLMMDLRLTRCCKRQVNDSCELMSHSDKLLRGYYGQMRCCDRLMRGSCGEVRAGACKHPSGWWPKFSVRYGNGGTTVTTKNYIRLRCTNFSEWNYTRSLCVNLVTFRHNSIVKVLWNFLQL